MAQQQQINFKKVIPITIVVIGIIILGIFGNRMLIVIDGGYQGVVFRTFGGGIDKKNLYGQGFHLISPWNKLYTYDMRIQEIEEEMKVLSSSGLEINIEISAWFWPKSDKLGYLHENVGENYKDKVMIPSLRSAARSVIGRYKPDELYSTKRESIQNEIRKETKKIIEGIDIKLDKILIRSITLPQKLKFSIENKLKLEQQLQGYEYKLKTAEKEAERVRIEAEGKSEANKILNASLSDKILKEKGIEATLKLSESENAKVIVVGGKDGLPIILGDN